MRIVHIAAGAGSMYCGACARDVNLMRGLIAAGHDVQVIPLYTPLRVEGEEPLPTSRIFYSGINVYLQQMLALFPPHPGVPRPASSKARRCCAWCRKFAIETRAEGLGPMTISVLAGKDGFQRKELAKLLDYLAGEVRPDVVTLTNSLLSGIAPEVKRRCACRWPACCKGKKRLSPACRSLIRRARGNSCSATPALLTVHLSG